LYSWLASSATKFLKSHVKVVFRRNHLQGLSFEIKNLFANDFLILELGEKAQLHRYRMLL